MSEHNHGPEWVEWICDEGYYYNGALFGKVSWDRSCPLHLRWYCANPYPFGDTNVSIAKLFDSIEAAKRYVEKWAGPTPAMWKEAGIGE